MKENLSEISLDVRHGVFHKPEVKVCKLEGRTAEICKWAPGIHDSSFFKSEGVPFEGSVFVPKIKGPISVYIEESDGTETVVSCEIHAKRICKLPVPLFFLVCLVLFAVVAGGLAVSQLGGGPTPPSNPGSSGKPNPNGDSAIDGRYQEKSPAATMSELQKEQITVTDQVSSAIQFGSGQKGTVGSWVLENLSSNKVDMQAEVYVGDDLIGTTALLKPGQYISSIKLTKTLAAGSYDAIAYINYYDPASQDYISKAGYKISVSVK
jgi:hypothetical protein